MLDLPSGPSFHSSQGAPCAGFARGPARSPRVGPRDIRGLAPAVAHHGCDLRNGAARKASVLDREVQAPAQGREAAGRELVVALRADIGPLAPPAGLEVLVGGGAADVEDVVAGIAADFPRTAAFILVSTYLVLFLLLRSVLLPLKALVMNTLSIAASFGP